MRAYHYLCIFCFFILTSCATHQKTTQSLSQINESPSNHPTTNNTIKKASASTLSSWTISGGMAAKNNNNNKGWSASLQWTQNGLNHYHIRLNGPLGGGAVLIEKNNGIVTYVDGPKKMSSSNADQLLLQQTGIQLPVNDLYYWVRAIPAPGKKEVIHYDSDHHVSSLTQSGYTINYTHYTSIGNIDLPRKIRLEGHGVLIKLIIKHWQV